MTTYAELQAQKEAIEKELLKRKTEAFNEVVTTFAATCKSAGFALDEMAAALIRLHNRRQRVGTKAPAKFRNKAPAKFRNTATGKTWSGRGKQPSWVGGEHSVAV